MKVLLDTQIFLWYFAQPEKLSKRWAAILNDEKNTKFISVASVWEVAIKVESKRLALPESVDAYFESRSEMLGAELISIESAHAVKAAMLAMHHKDPFDRMLVAQAQIERLALMTADGALDAYEFERVGK